MTENTPGVELGTARRMEGVSKRFPGTLAVDCVDFSVHADVVIVAARNSKVGMDSVTNGQSLAITYQSAEGDGAIAIHAAARWFSGEKRPPVIYLPKHIITKKDVDNYMPAQW